MSTPEQKETKVFYIDLKYYESKMKDYFDSPAHLKNVIQIVEEYRDAFLNDSDSDLDLDEVKTGLDLKSFQNENAPKILETKNFSFPHLSLFDKDCQVGEDTIALMRNKIIENQLTKYNIEWYIIIAIIINIQHSIY